MFWQGIPYPFLSTTFSYDSLNINKLPTIVVDSGFAWDSVVGAFIAGLIPAFIAWYTIKKNISAMKEDRIHQQNSFDRDRDAQIEIAKRNVQAQVLSGNRQQWINTLRESVSEYLSAIHSLRKSRTIARHCYSLSKKNSTDFFTEYADAIDAMTSDSRVVDSLKFKILLLINPNEDEAIEIKRILIDITKNTGTLKVRPNKQQLYQLGDELIEATQVYLKKEWVRVKDIN